MHFVIFQSFPRMRSVADCLSSHSTLNVSIPDCNYYLSISDLFRGLQALGKPGPIYLCRELISVTYPTWSASEVGNHQWFTGLPWRLRQWKIWLQCGRPRFNPWVSKISWRLEWLPTPVFLPGESHGQRSLVGCSPWGHKESDMTEWLTHTHTFSSQGIRRWERGCVDGGSAYQNHSGTSWKFPLNLFSDLLWRGREFSESKTALKAANYRDTCYIYFTSHWPKWSHFILKVMRQ